MELKLEYIQNTFRLSAHSKITPQINVVIIKLIENRNQNK